MNEIPEGFKRCARCKHVLPLDQFRDDHRTTDKLSYRCVECLAVVRPVSRRPMP